MITVKDIPDGQLVFAAIRASGPGGQNVNKVSSAIHLRFDVPGSSMPESVKRKLLAMSDSRISSDGVVVIKAQQHRSQEKNRLEALERLDDLLRQAQHVPKHRRKTKPSRSSVRRRLDTKTKHGSRKKTRGKKIDY
jgi:ribosome-associated protein